MRVLWGIVTLVWAFALLVSTVRLLDCSCADVWDFVGIGVFIVAGFALMLPDKEE